MIKPSSIPWPYLVVLVKKTTWFFVNGRQVNFGRKERRLPFSRSRRVKEDQGVGQVPLAPGYTLKTACYTLNGRHLFKQMRFKLANAWVTFQWLMNRVLSKLQYQINAFSLRLEKRLYHFWEYSPVLSAIDIHLKALKCSFAMREIVNFEHNIFPLGIFSDPQKVAGIHSIKPPITLR